MLNDEITELAGRVGAVLSERGETIVVAEGSAGGLISAALLSIPGASKYYLGGTVVYTGAAYKAWIAGAIERPANMRGATEAFATHIAQATLLKTGATWAIGEAGAAGPANPYGDPAGHCWLAICGPTVTTRHVLTGVDDRPTNMVTFATSALRLMLDVLS